MKTINIESELVGEREVKLQIPPNFKIEKTEKGYTVRDEQLRYQEEYERCCEILNIDKTGKIVSSVPDSSLGVYEKDNLRLFNKLYQLKVCRDAFWLRNGWRPIRPKDFDIWLFVILLNSDGKIIKNRTAGGKCFLMFPTEEMRDTFYEDFKELIEDCKEILAR